MTHAKPAYLTALGGKELPNSIQAGPNQYSYAQTFKNDFFAVTSLYEGPGGKVILKVQRQAPFLLLPLRWAGRILAARERTSMLRLQGIEGIPRLLGTWSDTGLIREFVEGRTLADAERVNDEFHHHLRKLIEAIHRQEMAYVDLEKPGNVLVGDDGKPYLFDFQIAWYWPRKWGGQLWPLRALLRKLQAGDRYHLIKLQRRSRPDQLSPQQLQASYHKPWYVRMHNKVTRPFTRLRRRVLRRLDPQSGLAVEPVADCNASKSALVLRSANGGQAESLTRRGERGMVEPTNFTGAR